MSFNSLLLRVVFQTLNTNPTCGVAFCQIQMKNESSHFKGSDSVFCHSTRLTCDIFSPMHQILKANMITRLLWGTTDMADYQGQTRNQNQAKGVYRSRTYVLIWTICRHILCPTIKETQQISSPVTNSHLSKSTAILHCGVRGIRRFCTHTAQGSLKQN